MEGKPVAVGLSAAEAGFSLVEAVIAAGLMAGALASLGQMFIIAVASNRAARAGSYATVLAQQKLEQLRPLAWARDPSGAPITDTSTNTALPLEEPTGGTGLSASPSDTLTSNTAGWVDYVDGDGNVLGGGAASPPNTAYIRRWSIRPLPSNPDESIVIQVFVTSRVRVAGSISRVMVRRPDEAWLMTIRTRKASWL